MQSKASNQSFWFNSRTETIEYGTIEEMISSSSLTGGTVLAADLNTDPGRISNNPDLTLIDQRTDNDMIVAVNGIRNLVNNAISEVGNTYDNVTAKMQELFNGYLEKVDNGEVKTKLMAFDPAETMYISESGVYYNGTATTKVMFAQSIRYISASSSAAGTKYDLKGATIQLPKTLLLVMPEALSRLSNVIFEGKNTQFITGSLDSAVAAASGLVMVTPSEISSREELKYEVIYTQKEAVYKDGEIEKTVKIDVDESNMALNGDITEYFDTEYHESLAGKTMLREYLVPSLKIINNGLFANVSGVEVIMSRSSNIIVCYAIAYGSNGTIIGTVVMGYCTDITAGSADKTNDPQNSTKDYLYNVSDPFQGYDFSSVFGEYTVKAYSGETEYTLTDDGTSYFLYEPAEGEGFPHEQADRFELLYGDRVFFVKYI